MRCFRHFECHWKFLIHNNATLPSFEYTHNLIYNNFLFIYRYLYNNFHILVIQSKIEIEKRRRKKNQKNDTKHDSRISISHRIELMRVWCDYEINFSCQLLQQHKIESPCPIQTDGDPKKMQLYFIIIDNIDCCNRFVWSVICRLSIAARVLLQLLLLLLSTLKLMQMKSDCNLFRPFQFAF